LPFPDIPLLPEPSVSDKADLVGGKVDTSLPSLAGVDTQGRGDWGRGQATTPRGSTSTMFDEMKESIQKENLYQRSPDVGPAQATQSPKVGSPSKLHQILPQQVG